MLRSWDAQRKKRRGLGSFPLHSRQHRIDKLEWSAAMKQSRRNDRKRQATKATRRPLTVATLLKYHQDNTVCCHCGREEHDEECGLHCYLEFRSTVLTGESLVEVREVGALGHGVFTKPWARIKKDQWLDEYFGVLRPLDTEHTHSRYAFRIPNRCWIDAEPCGNWTRFMNSHCRPNVKAEPEFVGKRCVIIFRALRNIGPGEELVFNYGKDYFRHAGIACRCSACRSDIQKHKSKRKVQQRRPRKTAIRREN